jgi:hypothetical protein
MVPSQPLTTATGKQLAICCVVGNFDHIRKVLYFTPNHLAKCRIILAPLPGQESFVELSETDSLRNVCTIASARSGTPAPQRSLLRGGRFSGWGLHDVPEWP